MSFLNRYQKNVLCNVPVLSLCFKIKGIFSNFLKSDQAFFPQGHFPQVLFSTSIFFPTRPFFPDSQRMLSLNVLTFQYQYEIQGEKFLPQANSNLNLPSSFVLIIIKAGSAQIKHSIHFFLASMDKLAVRSRLYKVIW